MHFLNENSDLYIQENDRFSPFRDTQRFLKSYHNFSGQCSEWDLISGPSLVFLHYKSLTIYNIIFNPSTKFVFDSTCCCSLFCGGNAPQIHHQTRQTRCVRGGDMADETISHAIVPAHAPLSTLLRRRGRPSRCHPYPLRRCPGSCAAVPIPCATVPSSRSHLALPFRP